MDAEKKKAWWDRPNIFFWLGMRLLFFFFGGLGILVGLLALADAYYGTALGLLVSGSIFLLIAYLDNLDSLDEMNRRIEEKEGRQRILDAEKKKQQKEWEERRREIAERDRDLQLAREQKKWEKWEQLQREKGLVKKISPDGKAKWVQPTEGERLRDKELGSANNFSNYTPREFESFIGDLFRKMGYEVELTPATGDYGVDIVAKKDANTFAIQVKKFAEGNLVGAQEVQKTLGAMWRFKADQSIIITTSGFTLYAREQAKEAPIELWDKRTLQEIVRKYNV